MASEEHRRLAGDLVVRCLVVTVSDSRTPETDTGGKLIRELLAASGHRVAGSRLVRDEPSAIRDALRAAQESREVDAVLFTGGTGIASRDRTPETVRPYLTRELPGFGELFRMLSYEEVGPAAMLSRALAGAAGDLLVVCLPGSPKAVRLAMEKLLLPELRHLVWELRRR